MSTDDTQFVITAPGGEGRMIAYGLGARQTIAVVVEIITSARERLTIAAPYLKLTPAMLKDVLGVSLYECVSRGINVEIATSADSFAALRELRMSDSWLENIAWYCPSSNVGQTSKLVSHAKFVVADAKRAYLGSANMTVAGMTAQYEMGLQVGDHIAARISAFWDLMIQRAVFVPCDPWRR